MHEKKSNVFEHDENLFGTTHFGMKCVAFLPSRSRLTALSMTVRVDGTAYSHIHWNIRQMWLSESSTDGARVGVKRTFV